MTMAAAAAAPARAAQPAGRASTESRERRELRAPMPAWSLFTAVAQEATAAVGHARRQVEAEAAPCKSPRQVP
jgi:hypothetical protein